MTPPRRRLRPALLAVPVALLVGVAGCAQAAAPSQEEYVAAADAVCQAADEQLEKRAEEHEVATWEARATGESNLNVDRPERWMRAEIVPEYETMSGNLKSIPAPDGDATYLTDLYADLDRRIAILQSRPSGGRDVIRADEELRRRFASYGMEVCGTV